MIDASDFRALEILGRLHATRPLPLLFPNLVHIKFKLPPQIQANALTSMTPPTLRVLRIHLPSDVISFDAVDDLLERLQAGFEPLEHLEITTVMHIPASTCAIPHPTCEAFAKAIRGNPQLARIILACRVEPGSMDEIFRQTARLKNLRSLELGTIHKTPEDLQIPAYLHLKSLTLDGNVEDTVDFLSRVASPVLEAVQLDVRFPNAPRYAYTGLPSSSDPLELSHFTCLKKVCRSSPIFAAHEAELTFEYTRST